jgi:hypothetical protein
MTDTDDVYSAMLGEEPDVRRCVALSVEHRIPSHVPRLELAVIGHQISVQNVADFAVFSHHDAGCFDGDHMRVGLRVANTDAPAIFMLASIGPVQIQHSSQHP